MLNKSRLGLMLTNQTRIFGFKKEMKNEDFKRF